MRLTGNVSMPMELVELLKVREKKVRQEDVESNSEDYLSHIPRLADILLMCVFYGFYRAKELPSSVNTNDMGSYEFNVRIDKEASRLRHALLMIWIRENRELLWGSKDEFRLKLYDFLKDILDDSYLIQVIFPFYLSKSAEPYGDVSFIKRLERSRFVEWEMKQHAPERIAIEFVSRMREFEEWLAKSLEEISETFE